MAETDFSFFGASAADIARGVTAGFTPPNGGGSFTFGFNSKVQGQRATGVYYNHNQFAPLRDDDGNATGGSIRCAMKRGVSSSVVGFSTGIFINLQGVSETDYGYFLGLSNNNPSNIVLAKTTCQAGLDASVGSAVALRVSSASYNLDTWVHLRLDAIVNPNGDTVLKCFRNDLNINPVSSPNWQAISGMNDFVDDALGIASGSNPYAGGYIGYFFSSTINQARGFIDYVQPARQV
jgi:hypothetical protein